MILASSFVFIWGIIFWKFYRDFNSTSYVANYEAIKTYVTPAEYNLHPDRTDAVKSMFLGDEAFQNDAVGPLFSYAPKFLYLFS